MYILNIVSAIKNMSVNELRYFIFENHYDQIEFVKERRYYSMKCLKKTKDLLLLPNKLIEKIPDPRNDKKHYQSIYEKEKQKISKTIKNNYLSAKNF